MRVPQLHCTKCAFFTTSVKEGVRHVQTNEKHTVTGPGAEEDTHLTIAIENFEDIR